MFVYVGTYTGDGQGKAEGIYVYRMDESTGALSHVQTVKDLNSPTFLAFHPQRPFVYSVERKWHDTGRSDGVVSAFSIDERSGELTLLNRQSSGGQSPAYVSVHPSGRYAFAANYGSGHVAAVPIGEDGHLGEPTSVVHHQGRSAHPRRQEGPHAHFITPDPTGRYVLSCDLGIDRVMIYRFDPAEGKLNPNDLPYAQVSSGAGPRHLAFHPSRRFVYVINEIDSTLSAFAWDEERGTMNILQTVSTVPEDVVDSNTTAQVVVHPSGKFVYGSNRGHDSIAIFAIDQDTGKVRLVGHEPTQGQTPRNFNVDPTGSLLLAANQASDTIVPFRIDQASGRLTATGHVTENPAPVCIIFRPS
jgi:6-phosphogluconolactonase